MELFLTLLSGIGWIIVYEECIRLGLKEKTYAMPFWALALNITWEITYTYSDIFLGAHGEMGGMLLAQTIVNIFWVIFDCVILYTYFKYGRKEWAKQVKSCFFVPYSLLVLVCSMALQFVFIQEFGFVMAAQYSAFLQNLLMSVLFISLFLKRNSMEGTSLILAFAVFIDTFASRQCQSNYEQMMVKVYFNRYFHSNGQREKGGGSTAMKKQKLNYRFHNPNTAEVTADYILKVFIEVNVKKVERIMQEVVEESSEEDKQEAK